MKQNKEERRPSKKNSKKENKKFPYKRGRDIYKLKKCSICKNLCFGIKCAECYSKNTKGKRLSKLRSLKNE